jgi:acyl carrier protein
MDRTEIVNLITNCFTDLAGKRATVSDEDTPIFGKHGVFDSMQLVTFLMELEQQVNERFGVMISIADDRALSQERSPFRTVGSLTDYITMLVNEQNVV